MLCVLSSACDQSGMSSDLDTMQNAAWRIGNAVSNDRPAELLLAMRAFEGASAVAHSRLGASSSDSKQKAMAQWTQLHDDVESQLQSPKGQRVVDAISTGPDAGDWVELHASIVRQR
jgi:hypothetical protein